MNAVPPQEDGAAREGTGELKESVFASFHHSRLAWVFKLRLEVLWVWILSFGKPSAHSARCYNLRPCLFCPQMPRGRSSCPPDAHKKAIFRANN